MKQLNSYIVEKLKINKDSRDINNSDDFFKYLQENGCIVIRPFTNKGKVVIYLKEGKEEAKDSWANETWTYPYFMMMENVEFFEPYHVEQKRIVFNKSEISRDLWSTDIFDAIEKSDELYKYNLKNANSIINRLKACIKK